MAAVAAPAIQPLAEIESAVRQLLTTAGDENTSHRIGRLDPRLRLPRCDTPLATRFTHGRSAAAARSVEVRCTGSRPWSLYVPVSVTRFAEVVVTTRPLERGTLITAEDIRRERRQVSQAGASWLSDPAQAVGMRAARRINEGQVVSAAQVERPQLVRRGDQVVLSSNTRGIEVRVVGEALQDGAHGEKINVLNLRSERVIQGVVTATGEVRVNGARVL